MKSRLDEAFTAVERRWFLRPEQQRAVAENAPLTIGYGQTNSQPSTVRDMLELLDVRPGRHILDVGCGSGWTTALLAHLSAPDGEVRGVEIVPELVEFGRVNLSRARRELGDGLAPATIDQATPGQLGLPELGPFERILVSAEPSELPGELVDQLADGGIMVIPVRGDMLRVRRTGEEVTVDRHGRYRFVPLV